jgi:hypothetical protein
VRINLKDIRQAKYTISYGWVWVLDRIEGVLDEKKAEAEAKDKKEEYF